MIDEHIIAGTRYQAALTEQQAANDRNLWALKLGLRPFPDGNQWCVRWGSEMQSGIVGFGDSPYSAMMDFERQIYQAKAPPAKKPPSMPPLPDDLNIVVYKNGTWLATGLPTGEYEGHPDFLVAISVSGISEFLQRADEVRHDAKA